MVATNVVCKKMQKGRRSEAPKPDEACLCGEKEGIQWQSIGAEGQLAGDGLLGPSCWFSQAGPLLGEDENFLPLCPGM